MKINNKNEEKLVFVHLGLGRVVKVYTNIE